MKLFNDVNILLSFINTKLRGNYKNLESLCDDLEIDENELKERLATINYYYDEKYNAFIFKK